MTIVRTGIVVLVSMLPSAGQLVTQRVEPKAGTWKTWVISSASEYRVPPPPDAKANGELAWMRSAVAEPNLYVADQVKFWDAGAPAYRWIDLIANRYLAGQPTTPFPHRVFAYMAMAMYDATVATWDSKYAYNRPRPAELDPSLPTRLPTPASPSYPSEHAATAAAAAAVLSYFFPSEASTFDSLANEAARSRLYAGVQFPTDYSAGLDLGRRVGARVVERAQADGSAAPWTGTVPTGPCAWVGTKPGNVTAANWKPILLSAPNEFRPPAPPDCHSPEIQAQSAEVRDFARTFSTNQKAMFWQSPEGLLIWPYTYMNKWMFEDKLDQNPPRAARAYALLGAAMFDVFISNQDAKFAYWYLRPHQLDPAIVPLFPVPNFPGYPSNHSAFSTLRAEILAYLFPWRADFIRAVGKEAGDSRIWAGIHFPIDRDSGVTLGESVARVFIDRARNDGSE
jgi:membrane-associated phospholipid phosphatase